MDSLLLPNRSVATVLTIAATLLWTGCSLLFEQDASSVLDCSAQVSPIAERENEPGCSTLADRREAQLLAVWLTGELRPDVPVTDRFCRDLERLRKEFADQYPVVANRRFQAAWVSRELLVKFSDSAATAIREGRYDGWKMLPPALRPDTLLDPPDELGWGLAGFDEVFHMGRMGARYDESNLPGLLESGPNHIGFLGFSTHPLLPLWDGNTLGLVFTGGSSRSPDHFFRICNGHPEFADRWDGNDNPPQWLRKAWEAWETRTAPNS